MYYSRIFVDLYLNIIKEYLVRTENLLVEYVTLAIDHMHEVYGDYKTFSEDSNFVINYNKETYQCAYLHKYAACHTALVYEIISLALIHNPNIMSSIKRPLRVCSLGCGPGTDVIGALTAMHDKLGVFRTKVKLIDIMPGWKKTFKLLLKELQSKNRNYGILSESTSKKYLDWSFLTADLLNEVNSELDKELGKADLITLVKFVSAAACKQTSAMIEKIFRLMKTGALILFIDNAAGGFQQLISDAASEHKFVPVFGPLNHELFSDETFLRERFGFKSCFQTRVSVQFLKKSNKVKFLNEMRRFRCNNLIVLPDRCWPEHKSKNINMSFDDTDLRNRLFGCESSWSGQVIHPNNSHLSPEPECRFRNECYSGDIPWGENDNFEFGNNYVPKELFASESEINSPNFFRSPDSFQRRFDRESNLGNFKVSVENGLRCIEMPYSSPETSFCFSTPLPYAYTKRRTVKLVSNNNNLSFQRNPLTNVAPYSSNNISNSYSSPDSLSYGPQEESNIQDISISQIDDYSAFRGISFENPSQNSSGYGSLASTPVPLKNRRPLAKIHNVINRRESFKEHQESPGPIRKRNLRILKQRKIRKPYQRF